jgi:hypothetical protein
LLAEVVRREQPDALELRVAATVPEVIDLVHAAWSPQPDADNDLPAQPDDESSSAES